MFIKTIPFAMVLVTVAPNITAPRNSKKEAKNAACFGVIAFAPTAVAIPFVTSFAPIANAINIPTSIAKSVITLSSLLSGFCINSIEDIFIVGLACD